MGKSIVITQSNYIPWKGYFDNINAVDEIVLYDDMQYTRRDWRNRNKIKTPQGVQWLTIPVVVKGKFEQKINETLTSETKWADKHLRSFQLNYGKAPCFGDIHPWVEEIYQTAPRENLTEINRHFIEKINARLGIDTKISDSREFDLGEGKTERLVNVCLAAGATDYYCGPASKSYLDESLFNDKGVQVHYFDYSGYPEYPQMFGAFEHAVTILDLLYNVGDEAMKYLKTNAVYDS
ncbi:WbqC family protein [bacterium SCSIO 12741]|nr:WbqC family protein [bacterium SCSIO 12741]